MPAHTSKELGDALIELYKAPRGATLRAIQEKPVLMTLRYVNERAIDRHEAGSPEEDAVAIECREALVDASKQLPGSLGRGVRALLGIGEGGRNATRPDREDKASKLLETSREALTHRRSGATAAEEAIRDLAEVVREKEDEFLLRQASHGLQARRPVDPVLAVKWLERYEFYYRMYTEISALRADSYAVLDIARTGEDEVNKLGDYVGSSLYHFGRFLILKEKFIDELGGIWIMSDADAERALADTVKLIEHFSPLTYSQESLLRVLLREDIELHPFLKRTDPSDDGRAARDRWTARLMSCKCEDLRTGDSRCRVHKMLRACEFYQGVLDADWYRLNPWYRDPPRYEHLVDAATLYRDIGLLADNAETD